MQKAGIKAPHLFYPFGENYVVYRGKELPLDTEDGRRKLNALLSMRWSVVNAKSYYIVHHTDRNIFQFDPKQKILLRFNRMTNDLSMTHPGSRTYVSYLRTTIKHGKKQRSPELAL
jgi:hypothetical protein